MFNRDEIIALIEQADKVPIKKVVRLLYEEGLIGKSDNSSSLYLCPHHSEKTGSFSMSEKFNLCKCFGCGWYARPVKLYAYTTAMRRVSNLREEKPNISSDELNEYFEREKHLSTWEAAVELCFLENLISRKEKEIHLDEIRQCRRGGKFPKLYPKDKAVNKERNSNYDFSGTGTSNSFDSYELNTLSDVLKKVNSKYNPEIIASQKGIHTVYTFLYRGVKKVRKDALLPHHRKHLKEVRMLTDKEIEYYKYFSLPTNKEKYEVLDYILKNLESNSIKKEILKYTPGFIYFEKSDSYSISTRKETESIGVTIEDLFRTIKRIQLRPDKGLKSAWFSTPKAGNCSSPATIRLPIYTGAQDLLGSLKPNPLIYAQVDQETIIEAVDDEVPIMFTEGDYKAVRGANKFNMPCISTQGLSSWYYMFVEYARIKYFLLPHNYKVTKSFIALDCDTKVKRGLFKTGEDIHRILKSEGIKTYYIDWDSKYGKGLDDVINNGHSDKLLIVDADIYEKKYYLIRQIIAQITNKVPELLEENDVKPFYGKLSEFTTKELMDINSKLKSVDKISLEKTGKKISQLTKEEYNKFILPYKKQIIQACATV